MGVSDIDRASAQADAQRIKDFQLGHVLSDMETAVMRDR
jgi:hypothetical protein